MLDCTDVSFGDRVGRELLCALLAGICGMPGGVLQFLPLYHPLHDIFGVHSENSLLMIVALYMLLVWSADRQAEDGSRPRPGERNRLCVTLIRRVRYIMHNNVSCTPQVYFMKRGALFECECTMQ